MLADQHPELRIRSCLNESPPEKEGNSPISHHLTTRGVQTSMKVPTKR